jgi:hypothetical protein
MKFLSMMVAASIAMSSPAMAADSGFDRSILRAAHGLEQVVGLPLATFDAVEAHTPLRHVAWRVPFARRFVRGTLGAPRRVVVAGEAGIRGLVSAIAREEGVPLPLAHGIVRVESNYSCSAHNRSGASGIMQVLPRTARGVGVYGNLHACSTGLRAGMRYLRQAFVRAHGNMCAAASLYNSGVAGSGRCSAYGRLVLARAYS